MSTTSLNETATSISTPATPFRSKAYNIEQARRLAALSVNRIISQRRDTEKVLGGEMPKSYFAELHGFIPKALNRGGRHSRN